MHKYPTYASRAGEASNILNPRPQASDLHSIISSVKSASSENPMTYWGNSQDPSAPYKSGSSMASTYAPDQSFMGRHPYSPPAKEGFISSHYNHSPFPGHMSIPGPGEGNHQQQSLHHQHQHQQRLSTVLQPHSQALAQGPQHTPENYGHATSPSTHFLPSLTLQTNSAYSSYPSGQHSPQNASEVSSQLSSAVGHGPGHSTMAPPPPPTYQRQYGSYSLPAMAGPVISHLHPSDTQIPLASGMHTDPFAQQMHDPLFGPFTIQQSLNDRPFKCDQCPQSFNRNHDLKRHRRIHLAIKPFPCLNCDKSFSRKDALKRHILVKSCGGDAGRGAKHGSHAKARSSKGSSNSLEEESASSQHDVISDTQSEQDYEKNRGSYRLNEYATQAQGNHSR